MKTTYFPKLKVSVFGLAALLAVPAMGAWQIYAQGMGNQTKTNSGTNSGSTQGGQTQTTQTQTQGQTTPALQGEAAAADKVRKATDVNASLAAATEYSKAYPNSAGRTEVSDMVVDKIKAVQDPVQRAALSEKLMAIFTGQNEVDGVFEMLLTQKQDDDAFRLGALRLAKQPNEVRILADLANAARDEIKVNNTKHEAAAVDYGNKAIVIIEAGNRPTAMNDTEWSMYKTKMLPALYQTVGLINYSNKDRAGAQKMFMKAMAIDSNSALTYVMLADLSDDQYQEVAQKAKASTDSKEKNDLFERAIHLLDQTIDLYLHAAAYSADDPTLAQIHDQAMKSLDTYYPFRHRGSKDGMQAEIDKLKKPAVNP